MLRMVSQRLIWLWLATRPQVSARTVARLLREFGTAEHLYAADREALAFAPGLLASQRDALADKDVRDAERIAAACDAHGIAVLTLADTAYPDLLRQIDDPPIVLYVRGTLPDLDRIPALAVVGTRSASLYGRTVAQNMGRALAAAGFVIVTGMALGVDGEAAAGALQAAGKVVAVFGCGVDICYPPQNRLLMEDILASGAVISEYPPGTEPRGAHFPVRNRIMSGLSHAALVVEAGRRSGALITARAALDQNRDVFAVPGNIDVPGSEGANLLLALHEAQPLLSPLDLVREYEGLLPQPADEERVLEAYRARSFRTRPETPRTPAQEAPSAQPEPAEAPLRRPEPPGLTDDQRALVRAVRDGAGTVDELAERTGFEAARVNVALTLLEIEGVLVRRGGRIAEP